MVPGPLFSIFSILAVPGDDAVEIAVGYGNQVISAVAPVHRDFPLIGRVGEQFFHIKHNAAGLTGNANVIFPANMPFGLSNLLVFHLQAQRNNGRAAIFIQ